MEDFDADMDEPRGSGSSIAAPLIRALLAAAIAFGAYWLVFAPGDPADDVAILPEPTVSAQPTVPPPPAPATSAPPLIDATSPPDITTPGQIGAGLSIQVLNGTDDAERYTSVITQLSSFGYDVTQSGRAANDYSQTTIFATAGQEAAAEALMGADGRFTVIGDNPGLDTSIDLHVVVGDDWVDQAAADATSTEPAPSETPSG